MAGQASRNEAHPLQARTHHIREQLSALVDEMKGDARQADDPRAQALFETSAEVLKGIETAYRHYEEGAEAAWR